MQSWGGAVGIALGANILYGALTIASSIQLTTKQSPEAKKFDDNLNKLGKALSWLDANIGLKFYGGTTFIRDESETLCQILTSIGDVGEFVVKKGRNVTPSIQLKQNQPLYINQAGQRSEFQSEGSNFVSFILKDGFVHMQRGGKESEEISLSKISEGVDHAFRSFENEGVVYTPIVTLKKHENSELEISIKLKLEDNRLYVMDDQGKLSQMHSTITSNGQEYTCVIEDMTYKLETDKVNFSEKINVIYDFACNHFDSTVEHYKLKQATTSPLNTAGDISTNTKIRKINKNRGFKVVDKTLVISSFKELARTVVSTLYADYENYHERYVYQPILKTGRTPHNL